MAKNFIPCNLENFLSYACIIHDHNTQSFLQCCYSSNRYDSFIMGLLPLLLLGYFNFLMIRRVRESSKLNHRHVGRMQHRQTNAEQQQQQRSSPKTARDTSEVEIELLQRERSTKKTNRSSQNGHETSFSPRPAEETNGIQSAPLASKQHQQKVDSSSKFQKRREKTTAILIAIVGIFIVCHTFRVSLKIYEIINPDQNTHGHFMKCQKEER